MQSLLRYVPSFVRNVFLLQAIESRKVAVEEVEKLLQRPEDLKRLDTLLEEYTQKHQA